MVNDEIIVYNNEPISAVFHSTSSGKTENGIDRAVNGSQKIFCSKSYYLIALSKYFSLDRNGDFV